MKNLKRLPKLQLDFASAVVILKNYLRATGLVLALTSLMLLIGRELLGEAVVAMLYLALVAWATVRWGQWSGICAAAIAFLTFNFFFIPPFYTFAVGRLEGWLVLGIFLVVAIGVVGRIQAALARAQASEREAIFMYELSTALAKTRTQQAAAQTLAQQLQDLYQAARVRVVIHPLPSWPGLLAEAPTPSAAQGQPDRIVPISNAGGYLGEFEVWHGLVALPAAESRLFQNFATQAGQAIERTRWAETKERLKTLAPTVGSNN